MIRTISLSSSLAFGLLFTGFSSSGCLMEPEEENDDLGVVGQEIDFKGHDYLFVTTPRTWFEAQTYCANYDRVNGGGYHLVTINDAREEAFLSTNGGIRGWVTWWIGYTDQGIEGSWIWTSGYSTHVNWAPGEPNNIDNEDCATDFPDWLSGWNDLSCDASTSFVCERDGVALGNKGSFYYEASDTNNATVNTVQYAVYLFAGQLFTVGTCGVPGAFGDGDTLLRLKDPFGVEIASNDDSGGACGRLSNISIVAPTTGTYTIHAGCYDDFTCSGDVAFNY